MRESTGIANAAVLPVPVCARPATSARPSAPEWWLPWMADEFRSRHRPPPAEPRDGCLQVCEGICGGGHVSCDSLSRPGTSSGRCDPGLQRSPPVWDRLTPAVLTRGNRHVLLAGCGSIRSPDTASDHHAPDQPTSAEASRRNHPVAEFPAAGSVRGESGAARRSRRPSRTPKDPRSQQGWNLEPVAAAWPQVRPAVGGHRQSGAPTPPTPTPGGAVPLGKHIPDGVPDTYGFNGFDPPKAPGDTVALPPSPGMGLAERGQIPLERQRRRAGSGNTG